MGKVYDSFEFKNAPNEVIGSWESISGTSIWIAANISPLTPWAVPPNLPGSVAT